MNRLEKLKNIVETLYNKKENTRDEWADWLYKNHIFLVAEYSKQLAKRYEANSDLVVAASILHDIADAVMQRENPGHEEKSNKIAEEFLAECDFTEEEIKIIVGDIIKFHGCKKGEVPKTLEGKIMASADAMAHLKSNFYDFALGMKQKDENLNEKIRNWALSKIERDYYNKIFFDEIRNEVKNDYERVKELFRD